MSRVIYVHETISQFKLQSGTFVGLENQNTNADVTTILMQKIRKALLKSIGKTITGHKMKINIPLRV